VSPQFTIPLAMVLIVAALLGAATTASTTGGDTTFQDSNLKAIMQFDMIDMKSIPGPLPITVPWINPSFFSGMQEILLWNHDYLAGPLRPLRYPLMALTFAVMLMVFISMGPVIVGVANVFARLAAGALGGVTRFFK